MVSVTPEAAGWRYVGFSAHGLRPGDRLSRCLLERETCIVVLGGRVTATVGGMRFEDIGSRKSIFEKIAPDALYAPQGTPFELVASTDAEIALCTAPGAPGYEPRLIKSGSLPPESRGVGANARHVQNILPETEPAERLLVVEVITPAGNWSSYPPHKHDSDEPLKETALEEVYYHRLDPPQGFAFQRIYTDDRSIDETMTVEDGDCVAVPRGYHPVGAPHGYTLYYLNVMAGPERKWLFKNDPRHEWMLKPS